MKAKGLSLMFPFDGHRLQEVRFSPGKVQVILRPDRGRALWCPECGERVKARKCITHCALDWALAGIGLVEIHYQARQACCALCHRSTTLIPSGISAAHRATWRAMRTASGLAAHLPLSRAARYLGLHDARVRRWDKAVMQQIPDPALTDLNCMLLNYRFGGHTRDYIPIVMNAVTGTVVYLAEGKRKDPLRAFFDQDLPRRSWGTSANSSRPSSLGRGRSGTALFRDDFGETFCW